MQVTDTGLASLRPQLSPKPMSQPTSPKPASIFSRVAPIFRFRLTTLFAAITVLSVWLAWRFHREPISLANVDRIERLNEIPCPEIFKLVYSSDRHRVAFVNWEQPVDVREAITLWPLQTVGADRELIDFAFSPDRRHVAYSENSTQAEIAVDGQRQFILETGADQPDVAKLWNVDIGRLVRTLDCGPDIGGLTPVFSHDGKTIAIGSRTSETVLFDVATGNRLLSLPKRESQELAFHPSDHLLAVSYADGGIRLWDTTTGELIAEKEKVAEEVYSLDWSIAAPL
jgi:WD40 repeat protein